MNRSRNWCFTLNNYTDEEYQRLIGLEGHKQIRYIIFGKEKGEQEETPHLQGFVIFNNAKTFDQVVKFFDNARFHIEKCIGTAQQNIAYCSKDEQYIEYGEPPKQGARQDIQQVKDLVKEGKKMSEICEVATSYQSIRMAELLIKYQPLKERTPPCIKWYWGETGSGKTREAWAECGINDTWVSHESLQWFDCYEGQKNVIIDDFRAGDCKFSHLLRYTDRYPIKVPVKGSYVNWVPEMIIITSTHHPKDVYKNVDIQENIGQLIRRINIIIEFKK